MVDITMFPTADQIARDLRRNESRIADNFYDVFPEYRDAISVPLEVLDAFVECRGMKLMGYRHQDDTWVLELGEDMRAVEINNGTRLNQPLGHGPAFAVHHHMVRGAGQRRSLARKIKRATGG